jgi:hypothetical protein
MSDALDAAEDEQAWRDDRAALLGIEPDGYVERLRTLGVFAEADAIFDAVDRGENPFTDTAPVEQIISTMQEMIAEHMAISRALPDDDVNYSDLDWTWKP